MSAKDVFVWLFGRNTKAGSRYLYGDPAAREQLERERAEIVERAYRHVQAKFQSAPADLQYLDGEYRVTVRSGYSFDRGRATTEILIYPRQNNASGSHWHIVIDDQGNEIMNEWRQK